MTAAAPTPRERIEARVRDWYAAEAARLGAVPAARNDAERVRRILKYMRRRKIVLVEDLRLHLSNDRAWPTRAGRTAAERRAEPVGRATVLSSPSWREQGRAGAKTQKIVFVMAREERRDGP